MAGVLLTTSGIAVLSMIFALHDGVKIPLFTALVLGVLWGFVILNLDRFLVLSMDIAGSRWNLLLMAAPRLALAAVLSLVISTPLVLRVFASDINAQLKITQLVNSANEAKLEKGSKEVQEYNQAQPKITADKAILAGISRRPRIRRCRPTWRTSSGSCPSCKATSSRKTPPTRNGSAK